MDKIEKLGAEKKLIDMKVKGLSDESIAEHLNAEFNSNISKTDVRNHIKKNENVAIKVMAREEKVQEKVAETYFNTLTQLNQLNREMWEFWYNLKKNPEFIEKIFRCPHCNKSATIQLQQYANMLKAADQIMTQIRHVDDVLGRLQKRGLNITYNYVDLSKKIAQVIPQVLKNSNPTYIKKILNMKKKKYDEENDEEYEEIQDFEEEVEENENYNSSR
jgi:hypothetical protein